MFTLDRNKRLFSSLEMCRLTMLVMLRVKKLNQILIEQKIDFLTNDNNSNNNTKIYNVRIITH